MREDEGTARPRLAPAPALGDYEREWQGMRPVVQNPWHTMDEAEVRQLLPAEPALGDLVNPPGAGTRATHAVDRLSPEVRRAREMAEPGFLLWQSPAPYRPNLLPRAPGEQNEQRGLAERSPGGEGTNSAVRRLFEKRPPMPGENPYTQLMHDKGSVAELPNGEELQGPGGPQLAGKAPSLGRPPVMAPPAPADRPPLLEQPISTGEPKVKQYGYKPIVPEKQFLPATKTGIVGIGKIKSHTGAIPSPLKLWWYVPENNEWADIIIPDEKIRSWIKSAAEYQDVPLEIMAVILQQENGANATGAQKFIQFGERTVTTGLQVADEWLFDLVPDRAFGVAVADGSSGIANLQRPTLRDAASYSEKSLKRPPLPDDVRYRIFGWDQDTRISGDDVKADLYYQAAHIRQLIDRITGVPGYVGNLTLDQVRSVIRSYNGSGKKANKYADDGMKKLLDAADGRSPLYFYQP